MRKLAKPGDDASRVFLKCISKVRNPALKAQLNSAIGDVADAANAFETAAQTATLHTLVQQQNIGSNVTVKQMSDVYDLRMVKKGAPGRAIYDRLMASPAHGRCPLCGQRTVSTLDHHLPKSLFPALAVVPVNLIPACAECNKAKLDVAPTVPEDQTFHPYYDQLGEVRWLHAAVQETSPASLQFFVLPPDVWDELTGARVLRHFTLLGLATLYGSHAAEELQNIRHQMMMLHRVVGSVGVRKDLEARAESCEANYLNSWQSATYRALAESDWYCEGGFV